MMMSSGIGHKSVIGALGVASMVLAGCASDPRHDIRLNQIGYRVDGAKVAVLESRSKRPVTWRLVDSSGAAEAKGKTSVFGEDAHSGEHLHHIDFSSVQGLGTSYHLKSGMGESPQFSIAENPFSSLKNDALLYFYHHRAGVPIEEQYVQRADLARPAGHVQERVTCFSGKDQAGTDWPGCDYTLDVTGGWYDAGDQGKYVVNGGITVWTLLNYYERRALSGATAFADGSLTIPERTNGISDLLDEVRFELEFLLAMQVPDGARVTVSKRDPDQEPGPTAFKLVEIDATGLVHHKVHDQRWTALPTAPHEDTETRYLYPPTTGSTLNLAAAAAQAARIWRDIDPEFAARCLDAAEKAFAAAERHPDIFAFGRFDGGGGYGDRDYADEFYWAAAELYLTTGDPAYEGVVRASPYFLKAAVGEEGGVNNLSWNKLGAAGTIALAMGPSSLTENERDTARKALIASGAYYLAQANAEGYGLPDNSGAYRWGSNGEVMNRAMVMAWAHEYSGDEAYLAGVTGALDYILGRNPNDVSYVSGYGTKAMEAPHHRFWAKAADPAYPAPPPGSLSGGPNNWAPADDVAREIKEAGCAPLRCWADDYRAFSLNEVAINWNAPLVWVASYLDEDR